MGDDEGRTNLRMPDDDEVFAVVTNMIHGWTGRWLSSVQPAGGRWTRRGQSSRPRPGRPMAPVGGGDGNDCSLSAAATDPGITAAPANRGRFKCGDNS